MPNWDTTAWASSHTTLKFRITFYVMSILILLAGIGDCAIRPKDVLPEVDIQVITIVWTYTGIDTPEMDKRVTTYSAFALSNNVNGIRNMESETLQGVTMTRIYFQPDVSIDLALSQVTAATNSVRAALIRFDLALTRQRRPSCHRRRCPGRRRNAPNPVLALCDADIVRASELEHPVQRSPRQAPPRMDRIPDSRAVDCPGPKRAASPKPIWLSDRIEPDNALAEAA